MAEKKVVRSVLSWITPGRAIGRAFDSVVKTHGVLKEAVTKAAESMPDQARAQKYPDGDLRNIEDARDRFEAMYDLHGWTEPEVAKQIRALRRTKITAIVMAIISLVGVLALAILVPVWMAMLLIPLSGCVLILGLAQAFKYALFEAQMNLREFISAREFIGRVDFWNRMLG